MMYRDLCIQNINYIWFIFFIYSLNYLFANNFFSFKQKYLFIFCAYNNNNNNNNIQYHYSGLINRYN